MSVLVCAKMWEYELLNQYAHFCVYVLWQTHLTHIDVFCVCVT